MQHKKVYKSSPNTSFSHFSKTQPMILLVHQVTKTENKWDMPYMIQLAYPTISKFFKIFLYIFRAERTWST